jgi:hypothetical protein
MAVNAINNQTYVPPVTSSGTNNNLAAFRNNIRQIAAFEQLLTLNELQSSSGTPVQTQLTSNNTTLNDAVLLNLSPQALNILNGISPTSNIVNSAFLFPASNDNLPLNQQQQLSDIFSEFGNAPLTTDTFTQLQSALLEAGINPEQTSLIGLLQETSNGFFPYPSLAEELVDTQTRDLLDA